MRSAHSLSKEFQKILSEISSLELSQGETNTLAKAIRTASDFYIRKPEAATPWFEPTMKAAQIFYYLPLNHLRAQAVVQEGLAAGFFDGLENFVDYGAGLGAAALALSLGPGNSKTWKQKTLVEQAPEARKILETMSAFSNAQILSHSDFSRARMDLQKSLVCFSYSLTEQEELPPWALQAEALMIIEPSTQVDGRKLLHVRDALRAAGYHIWAPCTHQEDCPLLKESKRDWCHDRIHFTQPEWFQKLERELPMKNQTLTMSYLLARRGGDRKPLKSSTARIIGDMLPENGKTRQLMCRSSSREFLTWMHRKTEVQEIPRGVLVDIPETAQKVSNEVRVTEKIHGASATMVEPD